MAATKASRLHQRRDRSKRELIHDTALRFLCPALWLTPAIVRAHETREYEKDRKHVQEVYVGYQEHRRESEGEIRKGSVAGSGRGGRKVSVKDLLDTYPAPLEWVAVEDPGRDPWRYETLTEEDPWLLPPIQEMV